MAESFVILSLCFILITALSASLLWFMYDQIRDLRYRLQKQKEFFTNWNQRIEDAVKEHPDERDG